MRCCVCKCLSLTILSPSLIAIEIFRDDVSKTTAGDGYVYESYYDDYTPEMEQEYSSSWQGGNNEYDATAQQNGPYYQQNENDGQQQYFPQQ